MKIDGLVELSIKINSTSNLANQFKSVFGSEVAKKHKGIVYFFMTKKPIPRVKGESNILYIGKTENSLSQRYFQHSEKLATGQNGDFYKYIIDTYGEISFGVVRTSTPKELESHFFKEYFNTYLEYPPKSKVG